MHVCVCVTSTVTHISIVVWRLEHRHAVWLLIPTVWVRYALNDSIMQTILYMQHASVYVFIICLFSYETSRGPTLPNYYLSAVLLTRLFMKITCINYSHKPWSAYLYTVSIFNEFTAYLQCLYMKWKHVQKTKLLANVVRLWKVKI